jgi:sugar lactone lactonase YvrE
MKRVVTHRSLVARVGAALVVTSSFAATTLIGVAPAGAASAGGTVTELAPIPTPDTSPSGIVLGPDGNYWFTEYAVGIGRMTPAGAVTEFTVGITPGSRPLGIAAGPDGNLWFTEYQSGKVGRITPAGSVTEHQAGGSCHGV